MKKLNTTIFLFIFFLLLPLAPGFSPSVAFAEKVYIDITAPGVKRLPIAVQRFLGNNDISGIVKDDLTFTGFFDCVDDSVQIEQPNQPFSPLNWQGLGVELVVKGKVSVFAAGKFIVTVSAHDVSDGTEVLNKQYASTTELSRQVAHSIANDIYTVLTGQPGIFKTKLAFINSLSGRKELYLMDWDGHAVRETGVTGDILLTPHWSSDKTKLLYSAERHRQWGIFVFDVDTGRERDRTPAYGLNIAGNFFPNSSDFVYTASKEGNAGIYIAGPANNRPRKIISSPWIDVSPSVSPDSASIVFVSNRSGNPQIYLADRDGYGIRRLTFQGNYNTSPVWSPKGDKIAFTGMISGHNQIFVINTDGSGLTQLTDRGNNENPSFSPDGKYLAFSSTVDGPKGIYLIRITGGGLTRVTPKGRTALNPGWSPM